MFLFALYCIVVQIFTVRAMILWRPDTYPAGLVNNCEVCLNERCLSEANYFKSNMDTTVDPCEDFYAFACGNFVKKHAKLPANIPVLDPLSATQAEVYKEILEILNEDIKPNELAAFKKVKMHYRNCMNKDRIDRDGTRSILELLEMIGGWPIAMGNEWNESKFDLVASLRRLKQKKYTGTFPFGLAVTPEIGNTSRSILQIEPPQLGVDPTFFVPGSKVPGEYINYIKRVAAMLSANNLSSEQEAELIFKIEIYMHIARYKADVRRHVTVKELSNYITTIPWLQLFNMKLESSGIQIDENEMISVPNLKFFSIIANLIEKMPKRILANYLGWSILQSTIRYSPENLKQLLVQFISAQTGTNISEPRELVCAKQVQEQFKVGLSSMYVRKYFDEQIKRNVETLFLYIKYQMRKNLQQVDWTDAETRREALDKLENMRSKIGYPEELLDDRMVNDYYSELVIGPGNYLTSALNVTEFVKNKELQNLRTNSQYSWKSMKSSTDVNGYYLDQLNLVDVAAAFLRGSLYQYDRPQYLNFGAIGTIIAHEITHAFDHFGRLFDKNGNLRDWWHPETQKKYLHKTECIVDQYNKFYIEQAGMNVNGIITQGENIADNGGIKLSYGAYNEWVIRNQITEMCLPNFENYTAQQMFWISAASNSCSAQQTGFLKHWMAQDTHAPGEARVIIPFSNSPDFARDFKCKPGSRMNPTKRCSVW